MGTPRCLLCVTETTCLQNPVLRETWKADEGVKWHWHSDACAYWTLCQSCHRTAWPEDHRVKNGSSKPWSAIVWGRCRLPLVGEFYITRPPPELLREPFASAAARLGDRPRRSRSPRLVHVTDVATVAATVGAPPAAFSNASDLPSPTQRSCLIGGREGSAPSHVDLGSPVVALRFFPDKNRLRKALRGRAKFRDACLWEEIVDVPLLPTAEKLPTHVLPAICDAASHVYPSGRLPCSANGNLFCSQSAAFAERLPFATLVHLSTDELSCHTVFLCPQCKAQLMRGDSLALRADVYGCGVSVRQFFVVIRRTDIL